MIGRTIGHYQVVEKLGEGGMGVAYKARDTTLGRFVVLKVLAAGRVADPERRRRFVQEARAASALNHPNIITVHDFIQEDGVDFIVMEYVDARTLDQIIPRKGLRLKEALSYAVPITDALARAHAAGIVHRDLKPSNVMVDGHGQVKVLDFGLAKLAESVGSSESATTMAADERPHTGEGKIVGTVAYMSPEQAEGKAVDARSDVFSFGSMLYEMLTGVRAFPGESAAATLAAVISKDPKPPGEIATDLPHDLEKIVLRCLRKDPARRFQTMADLKVELEDVRIESDSQGSAARPPVRARRWRRLLGAAVATALVGIATWYVLGHRAAPLPPAAVVPLTSDPGNELAPAFSPDGTQVAFQWNGEKGDNWDIYVKLVGAVASLRLTTDPARDFGPAWSPDGRQIAFQRLRGDGASIYLISPLGGPERKLADCRPARSPAMSWSPDGKWLAVAEREPQGPNGIFLLPVERGEKRRLTSNTADVDNSPAFSPGGRYLAYASCTTVQSCDVHLLELGPGYEPTSQPRRVTHQTAFMEGIAWAWDQRSLVYAASVESQTYPYLWRAFLPSSASPERLELAGPQANYPAISPVANRLAFSRRVVDEDIWKLEAGAPPRSFIASTRDERGPQFSPDGAKIAFSSSRSGLMEIWVCERDGSNPVQLTDRLGRFQATPRGSPAGRWIAFSSLAEDGKRSVHVVDAAGGQPRRLSSPAYDEHIPGWSRDGRWIYVTSNRSGRSEIWRMPSPGGVPTQVTDNGGYAFGGESWDGTIYYLKNLPIAAQPLYARSLAGGAERQVLDSVYGRSVHVVTDGIYHFAGADDQGAYPLQFFDFATGKNRVLARIDLSPSIGLTVSPDRRTILYTAYKPINYDLVLVENFR